MEAVRELFLTMLYFTGIAFFGALIYGIIRAIIRVHNEDKHD